MSTHETFATRNDPLLVKTADGCPLPLRRLGTGAEDAPAVLLVAGGDGAMRWWRALLPELCLDDDERRVFEPLAPREPFGEALQVVVWDGRGGGRAGRGHGVAAPRPAAADALRIARGLFERPVHLVGHGLGGVTAALSAVDAPDRVASLTLVAAPLAGEVAGGGHSAGGMTAAGGIAAGTVVAGGLAPDAGGAGDLALGTADAVRRALSDEWVAGHPETAAALLSEAAVTAAWAARLAAAGAGHATVGAAHASAGTADSSAGPAGGVRGGAGGGAGAAGPSAGVADKRTGPGDLVAAVAALDRPLLVVHGRRDALVPLEVSRTLVRRVGRGARLVELDGGHLLPVERAPELAAAVRAHVAAAEAR